MGQRHVRVEEVVRLAGRLQAAVAHRQVALAEPLWRLWEQRRGQVAGPCGRRRGFAVAAGPPVLLPRPPPHGEVLRQPRDGRNRATGAVRTPAVAGLLAAEHGGRPAALVAAAAVRVPGILVSAAAGRVADRAGRFPAALLGWRHAPRAVIVLATGRAQGPEPASAPGKINSSYERETEPNPPGASGYRRRGRETGGWLEARPGLLVALLTHGLAHYTCNGLPGPACAQHVQEWLHTQQGSFESAGYA